MPSIRKITNSIDNGEQNLPGVMIMETLDNDALQKLLRDLYNSHCGRLTNLDRMLLWYPDYLKHLHTQTQCIMLGEGPLSIDLRYYLAILVKIFFCSLKFIF